MANEKPHYENLPIGSVEALSQCLNIPIDRLNHIAENAKDSYTEFSREAGKHGKKRTFHEPKTALKAIQKKINKEIFESVLYPDYLHGGLKERDYVSNVSAHSGAKTIIGLDITNFYPSISRSDVFNIYKNLFKFHPDVCEVLTKITTKNGAVAQGGCCSSYIANLVFFNSEFTKVSRFRGQGLTYTRLLDDITISSKVQIPQKKAEYIISEIAGLFTKHKLELNTKKTKIEHSADSSSNFEITGLWAAHKTPKIRKKDRRYVRQLVHICNKEFSNDPYSKDYHALWNRASGKVAVLTRLGHAQARDLRSQLTLVLPLYDDDASRKLQRVAYKLCQTPDSETANISKIKAYRKIRYHFGILARNNKLIAKKWKHDLDLKFKESAKLEREHRA